MAEVSPNLAKAQENAEKALADNGPSLPYGEALIAVNDELDLQRALKEAERK